MNFCHSRFALDIATKVTKNNVPNRNEMKIISSLNMNIIKLEQHVESDDQLFFMRIEAEILDGKLSHQSLEEALSKTDKKISGFSKVFNKGNKQNLAILVTKESLPLYDIMIKNQTEEINSNIKLIISNHKTLESVSTQFDIDFLM